MTTTTTYSPGDRVRFTRAVVESSVYELGSVGTVDRTQRQDDPDTFGDVVVWVHMDDDRDDRATPFHVDEIEPLPDPTDPTSTPDDPDRPVGEVIDVVPGALVRQPAGSRRPDPADVASSSQAGLAALIPLRETVPPQAARDLMAGAGIDLDGFDRALAQAREGAEEAADRPALTAYEDGEAAGYRLGLLRALRIVERYERVADVKQDHAGAALLGDVRDAIRSEVAR